MRRLLLVLSALLAFLAVACGDDDSSTATGEPDATGTPAAAASARGGRTATAAELQELARLQVPGYTSSGAGATLTGAGAVYTATGKTAGGAELSVRVLLGPCDAFVCGSLDPKQYETAEAQRNIKSVLPAAHLENPALRWEFGPAQLAPSAAGLYYYAVSYLETKGADGSVTRSSVNSYRAWYHNGAVVITFEVFARNPVADLSLSDVEKRMTKAEAERATREVFAVYGPKLPAP